MDKARINRWVSACLVVVLALLALVLMMQLAARVFGPSKTACTKQVCLSRYLQGPPAFNDEAMTAHLHENYFTPPAASDYHLSGLNGFTQHHQEILDYIKKFFDNKRGGTFVDLGAGDGEYRSLTLPLEKELGWTGLLVEPNQDLYARMLKKGRKATLSRNCVSPFSYPAMMTLKHPRATGTEEQQLTALGKSKLSQLVQDEDSSMEEFKAQCVPLENLIYAAGMKKHLDLLVLDMAGSDLDVLLNARLDVMPDIDMIVVYASNTNMSDDIGGYFLERNMVVKKNAGSAATNAIYALVKFDAKRDL